LASPGRTFGTSLSAGLLIALAGCGSAPRIGRDGPPAAPPSNLVNVPDAQPRVEPIRSAGSTSKPYTVLGRAYQPITDDRPLRESGLASWYGRQFHGQSTASGEAYDMYAMTAAHKTLPLPSYVRVRNPANGREAIVRVNDRGPFHDGRVIDLSYTAALKLDLLRGVAPVEIERLTNDDIRTGAWRRDGAAQLASAAPTPMSATASQPIERAHAAQAIAVPVAWTTPVATQSADRAPLAVLAQAPSDAPPTASDAAPPPRFRNMEVTDLPPMAPIVPTAPVAPPAAAAPPLPAASGAAPAASPAPPSGTARAASTAGFWVQLGAFRERESADSLLEKTGRDVPALASQLRVLSEAGTHRVQAGPFGSREAASSASVQVRDAMKIAPMVVERR